jgi:hypothetical protein
MTGSRCRDHEKLMYALDVPARSTHDTLVMLFYSRINRG